MTEKSHNPFKGELPVQIGDTSYNTRLNIDACLRLEQHMGCSLLKMAQKLQDGDLLFADMVNIMSPALRGGGHPLKDDEIKNLLYNNGYAEALKVTSEVIANVLSGGKNQEEVDDEKKLVTQP